MRFAASQKLLSLTFVCLALSACDGQFTQESTDAGSLPEDDAVAARTKPAPLTFGDDLRAELAFVSPSYLFTFELSDAASVSFRTQAVVDGPVVDTMLLLSRLNQRGQPRLMAASDDFDNTLFSGLDRKLGRGKYQLVVRGRTLLQRGPFVLTSSCTGVGCPAVAASCLFGEQFQDLRDSSVLSITSEQWISNEAQLGDVVTRDQLVLAVQQSSYDDVVTPTEALAVVDEQQIRQLELMETSGTRAYTVYEYGVGDNSYGAIFEAGALTKVASIHDGDLLDCTVSE